MPNEARAGVLQGTLDLMILQRLAGLGPMHGYWHGSLTDAWRFACWFVEACLGTLLPAEALGIGTGWRGHWNWRREPAYTGSRQNDSSEIERIGAYHFFRNFSGVSGTPDSSQQVERLWPSELFTCESGHETSATNLAACFHAP